MKVRYLRSHLVKVMLKYYYLYIDIQCFVAYSTTTTMEDHLKSRMVKVHIIINLPIYLLNYMLMMVDIIFSKIAQKTLYVIHGSGSK